jgi:Fe/S biogenesis protein NfuA
MGSEGCAGGRARAVGSVPSLDAVSCLTYFAPRAVAPHAARREEAVTEPLLNVSESAARKLEEMKRAGKLANSAVRLTVHEDGAAFHYQLQVVEEGASQAGDSVVESPAVRFFIDGQSLPMIRGATLDYVDDLSGSGFRFENPNKPKLLGKPLAAKVQKVLDDHINPGIAAHGGHVRLIDVEDGRVYVQLGGGCQGCGMVDVTLKQGIEEMLRREIPEVSEVLDTTDHAAGTNPYYQPGH